MAPNSRSSTKNSSGRQRPARQGPARVDWPVLAEAGWVGLEVPERLGGAGATFAEVAVICEELGRAASASSYLGRRYSPSAH